MNRRTLIIILAAGALVIVAIIVAVFVRKPAATTNTNTPPAVTNQTADNSVKSPVNTTNQVVNTPPNQPQNTNTAPPTERDDQAQVLRLARTIVERYGSYSNRNNFENITSLEPFMTEDFKQRSLAYIDGQHDQGVASEFYGISTSVASLDLTNYTAGSAATIRVATRRIEQRSHQDPTTTTQYAIVIFKSIGGHWKVDNITWE
jgi:hypothetical protein